MKLRLAIEKFLARHFASPSSVELYMRYGEWKIYRFKEAYLMQPANRWIDLFIAYKPKAGIMEGVDVPDLLADIDEASRQFTS